MRNGSRRLSGLFLGGSVVLTAVALLAAPAGCGDDTTGAGGSGSTGGGGSPDVPSCTELCDNVMENCTGDNQVYATAEVCKAVCAKLPPGSKSDIEGNTVGCRIYHAGDPAKSDPATHCPHAGPGGDGYCGTNCESYCAITLETCPSEYENTSECMTACEAFPQHPPFSVNQTTGDTIECRLYHVSVATTDESTHCPHVGVDPSPGTCVGAPP
jgi:hypothetical protein